MALFTSDKNSEKVQKTEAVLEDAAKKRNRPLLRRSVHGAIGRLAGTFLKRTSWA